MHDVPAQVHLREHGIEAKVSGELTAGRPFIHGRGLSRQRGGVVRGDRREWTEIGVGRLGAEDPIDQALGSNEGED